MFWFVCMVQRRIRASWAGEGLKTAHREGAVPALRQFSGAETTANDDTERGDAHGDEEHRNVPARREKLVLSGAPTAARTRRRRASR